MARQRINTRYINTEGIKSSKRNFNPVFIGQNHLQEVYLKMVLTIARMLSYNKEEQED